MPSNELTWINYGAGDDTKRINTKYNIRRTTYE
jgi:hypothetical protein